MPTTISTQDQESRVSESAGTIETAREILRRTFAGVSSGVTVSLEDGTVLHQAPEQIAALIVPHPGVLRELLTRSSDLAAGEAVASGDIALSGDVEQALAAMDDVAAARTPREWLAIASLCAKLPPIPRQQRRSLARKPASLRGRLHSPQRDRAAIAYHYNLSNDFYALWLDDNMTYSCAYFRNDSDTLDDAQLQKCDLICRKIRLRQGERLLDVGCGWGSLVRFAAREYGARATGVTLSEKQAEYARRRIDAEGLAPHCTVELLDYRELRRLGTFDKAASVGMVEHVGDAMLDSYFTAVFEALVPGGLFLNHGIIAQPKPSRGAAALRERFLPQRSHFTERYVFPDGEMPRLPKMTEAAQRAGFEVRHIENLREHYTLTLRHWRRRLEAREASARANVGDATYNIWRLWLAGSAHSFAIGRLGVVQMLLAAR